MFRAVNSRSGTLLVALIEDLGAVTDEQQAAL